MPRYKVVLEFDHPGDGHPIEDHSITQNPSKWNWAMKIDMPEVTNLIVETYMKDEWKLLHAKKY